MLRKDREVKNIEDIADIIGRCDTLRIGLNNDSCPYIVPVSFGVDFHNGKLQLFFHCAQVGEKINLIEKNPYVGFEADIFYKTEPMGSGITARYESIIGNGLVSRLENEEKIYGLKCILEHYHYSDFDVTACKNLNRTAVYKIEVDKITGKRNLPV